MLIASRGNPRLPALSDSPVKLVASAIRAWWGEGGRIRYYPIKQLWCSSNRKFKSIPRRYRNLALSAWKKFIFLRSIGGTKKRRRYFPVVNLVELIDRRQSLVAGYCQGAVVILTYNELVISYSPVSKLVLGPACSTLPDGP